ncbi:MAG: dihydrofolate reductase [Granulosicoccus sp.]
MSQPEIAMMMAMDKNRLIGKAGGLPWHVPGELAYFKRVTLGKPVIMGRKTFESIGKPLPGRTNIVVTRNTDWMAEDVVVRHDLDSAVLKAREVCLSEATRANEMVVIGGAGLCRDAMAITRRLYLTVIDQEFEGDTWLDSFSWDDWQIASKDVQDVQTTGGLPVTYWVLEKA